MTKTNLNIIALLALVGIISLTAFYLYSAEDVMVVPKENTTITFSQTETDLGIIKQGTPKEVVFILTNTGSAPLLIYDVETSCGCTGAEWTKKPIKTNKQGEIKVTYDAKDPGRFIKTITVYGNIADGSKTLQIKGIVQAP